mgnify:CR=1
MRHSQRKPVDRSGTNYTKSLVTMNLEGRFGFAVKRPNAFAEIALALHSRR